MWHTLSANKYEWNFVHVSVLQHFGIVVIDDIEAGLHDFQHLQNQLHKICKDTVLLQYEYSYDLANVCC